MDLGKRDLARSIAADLSYLRSTFDKADETYRDFRAMIISPGTETEWWPVEWIPTSDN